MPAADERAQRSDPRDWLIALALADRVLPPVPGDEIEAAECLTPEDRAALASLGRSEDLIDGLLQSMPSDDSAMAESASEDLEQQTADATMNRLAGSGEADPPIDWFMRDAKMGEILGGTSEVMRMLISRKVLASQEES